MISSKIFYLLSYHKPESNHSLLIYNKHYSVVTMLICIIVFVVDVIICTIMKQNLLPRQVEKWINLMDFILLITYLRIDNNFNDFFKHCRDSYQQQRWKMKSLVVGSIICKALFATDFFTVSPEW